MMLHGVAPVRQLHCLHTAADSLSGDILDRAGRAEIYSKAEQKHATRAWALQSMMRACIHAEHPFKNFQAASDACKQCVDNPA